MGLMTKRYLTAALFLLFWAVPAQAFQLKSFKDELFRYPPVTATESGGRYIAVAYDKQRDIYQRDRIPLRKVKRQYVNENVRWSRRVRSYKSANGTFKYFAVGSHRGGARITVVFIHGKNGNRFLGVNDWTFGGNFNRLQNLMTRNKGLLLTPEFTDFKERGTQDIATLIQHFRAISPNTAMIVACGSMGSGICWRLAKQNQTAALIDGLFILGGHWHDDFLKSDTAREPARQVPIWFGHGSWDPVFDPKVQKGFFDKLLKISPSYPARFVMFDTGKHGTPIRMVDWRQELNWILSLR